MEILRLFLYGIILCKITKIRGIKTPEENVFSHIPAYITAFIAYYDE